MGRRPGSAQARRRWIGIMASKRACLMWRNRTLTRGLPADRLMDSTRCRQSSTEAVDNFVGKPWARAAIPRQIELHCSLLHF